jgi:alkylation response protein AidB-like acyl-CoA dehydrogenase
LSRFADLHDELRAVAREVLGREGHHDARWRHAADAGWTGLEVPDGLGGSGATFAETAVVLEEVGRAASPLPFLGTALGVAAAAAAEPGGARDELMAGIAAGSTRTAVALAPHADAAEPDAPFRLDAAGRLTGRAELVLDAPGADHLLLLAEAPGGLVLVDLTAAGARVEAEPLVDATRAVATVTAEGVAVAPEAVWGFAREPWAAAASVLDRASVAVAADGMGAAAAMLDATVAYAAERRQFDRPIGSFQAVKHQCADALVQLRIGGELLAEAVAAVVAERDAALEASRAASHLGDAAVRVVGTAVQLHGGVGYTWESGIHRYLKRVMLDRALFGSPAQHRRRIADRAWPVTK